VGGFCWRVYAVCWPHEKEGENLYVMVFYPILEMDVTEDVLDQNKRAYYAAREDLARVVGEVNVEEPHFQ